MTTPRLEHRRKRFYEKLTLFRAVNLVAGVALALTFGGAVLERLIEPQTFGSMGEACWWAIVTVSTTGYGDTVPQTTPGRIVGSLVMINALALVPVLTAIVTALLVRKHEARFAPSGLECVTDRLERLERLLVEVVRTAPDAAAVAVGSADEPEESERRKVA
jgi:hypothetical protein